MNPPPPFSPAPPSSRKRPNFVPILITIACAALLAVGSCFGAIITSGTDRGMSNFLGYVFVGSALLFVVSFIGFVVWAIITAFRS